VNCLVSGERYWFCYDISFARDCRSVRFYTNIRTVSGVLLGGGTYPETGAQGVAVSTGQTGTLRLQFTCSLNSGTYFVSCGLGGDDGQSLHRIIDAVAFRVFERTKIFSVGYVDFLFSPELHLDSP
jgi:lipopolysaccharide transport system ATP-binding protein